MKIFLNRWLPEVLVLAFLFQGCAGLMCPCNKKVDHPDDFDFYRVFFGTADEHYVLLESRQLFRVEDGFQFLGLISSRDKKTMKKWIANFDEKDAQNQGGFYIRLEDEKRPLWEYGPVDGKPKQAVEFFQFLFSLPEPWR